MNVWGNGAGVEVWQDTILRGVAWQTNAGQHDTVAIAVSPDMEVSFIWRYDSILAMFAPNSNKSHRFKIYNSVGDVVYPETWGLLYDDTLVYTLSNPCFACWEPSHLQVAEVQATSAFLTWQGPAAASFWYYELVEVESGTEGHGMCTGDSLNLTSLQPSTRYVFTLYAYCGEDVSDSISIEFTTTAYSIDALPYITGFELGEDRGWNFENGVNAWVIDTAGAKDGEYGLYISSDGGATNGYTDQECVSFAWREIELQNEGQYDLEFDWRCLGERLSASYDYMRVFLAPDSYTFEANAFPDRALWPSWASVNSGYFNTYTPVGWVAFTDNALVSSRTWQHFSGSVTLDSTQVGMWRLCFVWTNDQSTTRTGNQNGDPAAAIDNIRFTHICATAPEALTLDSITDSGNAYLHWIGGGGVDDYVVFLGDSVLFYTSETSCTISGLRLGTNYKVAVASLCSTNELSERDSLIITTPCINPMPVPYMEDFEYVMTGYPINPCWLTDGYMTVSNYQEPDNHYLFFNQAGAKVVLPVIDTAISALDLMVRAKSSMAASVLVVGVATSTDSTVVFDTVQVVNIPADNVWRDYTVSFSSYLGTGSRIVLSSSQGVSVDDILVDHTPNCARPYGLDIINIDSTTASIAWSSSEADMSYLLECCDRATGICNSEIVYDTLATLTGLSGNTSYTIKISAICDDGSTTYPIHTHITTGCSPLPVPYSQDFNAPDGNLPCWQFFPEVGYTQLPHIQHDELGNGELFFGNAGGTVVLPQMGSPLSALQLEFDYNCLYTVASDLYIGVMEDSVFIPIDTVTSLPSRQVQRHSTYFASYTGTSRTIALRSGGAWHNNIVDNLSVDYLSSCLPAQNVHILSVTDESITLDWDDPSPDANAWEVQLTADTTLTLLVSSHPYTISGLQSATQYDIRVRTLCTSDTAIWAAPISGLTSCSTAFISDADTLLDDFESESSCWMVISPTNTNSITNLLVRYAHRSGTQSVNVPSRDNYLFSPHFVGSTQLMVKLFHRASVQTTQAELHIGYATSTDLESIVWLDTIDHSNIVNVWNPYALMLPTAAEYIVLHKSNDEGVLVDDVMILPADSSLQECEPVDILSIDLQGEQVELTWASAGGAYYYTYTFFDWDDDSPASATSDTSAIAYAWRHYGDTMTFGVRRVCPSGLLSPWNIVHIEIVDPNCLPPTDFSLQETTSTSVRFGWDTVAGPNECEMMLLRGSDAHFYAASASPAAIPDLSPATTYRVIYRSLCGEHHPGPWSTDTIVFTTDICHTVSNLTAHRSGNGAVILDWTPVEGSIDRWVVYFRRTDQPGAPYTLLQTATRPFAIDNLQAGVEWELRVASYCTSEVLSDMSEPLFFSDEPEAIGNVEQHSDGLLLMPNPASSSLTLLLSSPATSANIHILDLAGRLQMAIDGVDMRQPATVDISHLPAGGYFVRVTTADAVVVKKLIVRQ